MSRACYSLPHYHLPRRHSPRNRPLQGLVIAIPLSLALWTALLVPLLG